MKYAGIFFMAMLLVQFMASVQAQEQTYTCRVIDWETDLAGNQLDNGATITTQFSSLFTLTGTGRKEAGQPRIYDSANPSALDPDLGTPNDACGGLGHSAGPTNNAAPGRAGENCVARSKILILSKPTGIPNDLEKGGQLTFTFAQAVRVDEAGILDIDSYEAGGTIKLYGAGDALLFTYNLQGLGDNTYQTANLGSTEGVTKIVVDFLGSGGVTHLKVCVPDEGFPGCPDDSVCPCDADTRTSSIACLESGSGISHHTVEKELVFQFLDTPNLNAGNGCQSDSASA